MFWFQITVLTRCNNMCSNIIERSKIAVSEVLTTVTHWPCCGTTEQSEKLHSKRFCICFKIYLKMNILMCHYSTTQYHTKLYYY